MPAVALPDATVPAKASSFIDRFREIVSDPLNILIARHPMAGVCVEKNIVMTHPGLKVPIVGPGAYYAGFSEILVINRGVHEPLEEFVFQEVLKVLPPEATMLELGAYWSHYSMWFKRSLPGGSAILVEPDPEGLEAGKANFRRNGLEGQFIQAMVGRGGFEVDAFLRESGRTKLDVLHSDIQGFEVEMLEGAVHAFRERQIDYVFVSTHGDHLHSDVRRLLTDYGYRIEVDSEVSVETTSHDGLVFASSPNVVPVFDAFRPLGRVDIVRHSPAELLANLTDCLRAARKP